ncbi:MAG: hypothetical protein ABW098_11855 [Candidatus Thiodiazotropha sp.]
MKFTSYLLLVSLLFLQGGCETTKTTLKEEYADSIFDTTFFVIIPQDQIIITKYDNNVYKPSNPGIIANLITAYESSKSYKRMLKTIRPLAARVRDLDFGQDYINELKNRLLFTNPNNISYVENPPKNAEEFTTLINSAPTSTVVILETDYTLDVNYSTFSVNTILSYWDKTKSNPIYKTDISYISKPVSLDHSKQAADRALPLWVKDKQRHYRASYRQGIEETANLIATALTERYDYQKLANHEMYTFHDYLNQEIKTGKVLFASVLNQMHILDRNGVYYSITARDMTYDKLSADFSETSSESGRVYIYCPAEECILHIQPTLYVDDKKYGYIYRRGFFYLDLPPGKHTLTFDYDGPDPLGNIIKSQVRSAGPLEIDVKNGKDYHVMIRHPGWTTIGYNAEIVTKETALPDINYLQYTGSFR